MLVCFRGVELARYRLTIKLKHLIFKNEKPSTKKVEGFIVHYIDLFSNQILEFFQNLAEDS
jgi:hypothetical protein